MAGKRSQDFFGYRACSEIFVTEASQTGPLTKKTLSAAAKFLAMRDPDLGALLTEHGTPPLWARRPGFPTLIRIILEQQVSLASARSVFERFSAGVVPLMPERVHELEPDYLRSLGLTRQKAAYCFNVARAVTGGKLHFNSLFRMSDEDAKASLTAITGIGSWTADIYLLMALRRADVWPAGDLALATAVRELKKMQRRPDPEETAAIARSWRPFRSVAARMLWQDYLAARPG